MSGWLFLLLTILATVTAQLFFKLNHLAGRRFYLLVAIGLFCAAVPCTLLATRDLGIGRVYIGAALSYVLTPLAAVWLFGEQLRRSQWTALAVIVAGIALYSV
ncbi:DMT family transporter [Frateuria sp. YIM B11624]|uniref:DMT family transporter n=1 Tax=Frateuria sp. YIM B11624 TaxID=3143185 RepID=UPI003C725D14